MNTYDIDLDLREYTFHKSVIRPMFKPLIFSYRLLLTMTHFYIKRKIYEKLQKKMCNKLVWLAIKYHNDRFNNIFGGARLCRRTAVVIPILGGKITAIFFYVCVTVVKACSSNTRVFNVATRSGEFNARAQSKGAFFVVNGAKLKTKRSC